MGSGVKKRTKKWTVGHCTAHGACKEVGQQPCRTGGLDPGTLGDPSTLCRLHAHLEQGANPPSYQAVQIVQCKADRHATAPTLELYSSTMRLPTTDCTSFVPT